MRSPNTITPLANIPFWSQLRWNLIIVFILLALAPVAVVLSISLSRTNSQATNQVFSQLESVSELKRDQIIQWLDNAQNSLEQIVADPETEQKFIGLAGTPVDDPIFIPEQLDANTVLLNISEASTLFQEIFFYTREGLVIAASNPVQIGKLVAIQPYYAQSLLDDYVQPPFYAIGNSELVMFVTHPIFDASGGQIAGVLIGKLDISTLGNVMTQRVGLGESGETYLVSQESNYLLTPSRFDDEGYVSGQAYYSEGIDNALNGKKGFGIYGDYRDPPVPVLGVYDWIPELKAGILSEIDVAQGLAAYQEAQGFSILVAVLTTFLAALAGLFIANRISSPIILLTNAAVKVAAGNLEQKIEITQRNEIGMLAQAFASMTQQISNLIGTLEQRVADRTRALETSTEVGRRLSTILNQGELVREVVEQVQQAFNYYHAHIYLWDDARENLLMVGGTGEAGRLMLASGHSIPAERGLVGRAAETGNVVLVPDVSKAIGWVANPLLSETKSEIAVPIAQGKNVLGVLDVQDDEVNRLAQADADLLLSIANQVAVALLNIQSTEVVAKRAKELQTVAKISTVAATIGDVQKMLESVVHLTQRGFGLYHAHVFTYNENLERLEIVACGYKEGDEHEGTHGTTTIPLAQEQSLVARAARTRQAVIVNDVHRDPGWLPNPLLPDTTSELAVPMIVGDQLLGVLDVQSDRLNAFTEEDASIQTTLASQVATALQNARSIHQAQEQAERETVVNLITQKIQSATSIEAALQVAARELGHALGMKQTLVTLELDSNGGRHVHPAYPDEKQSN